MIKTKKNVLSLWLVSLAVLLVGMLSLTPRLFAGESPTITISNQSSETVLTKFRGPTGGSISIPAGGSRTVQVSGGNYLAFCRYGSAGRYNYSKVGPFSVVENESEVSEITIVLHTMAGNTQEQPSNEREFGSQ